MVARAFPPQLLGGSTCPPLGRPRPPRSAGQVTRASGMSLDILSLREITRWRERWRSLKQGGASSALLPPDHLPGPHPTLLAEGPVFRGAFPAQPCCVLVPLCGASADLEHLASSGFQVVGVEVAAEAIDALRDRFPELQLPWEPQKGAHDGFERFEANGLLIYRGDFLSLTPVVLSLVGRVDCVWDRAALDLVHSKLRHRYTNVLRAILPLGGKVVLVLREDRCEGGASVMVASLFSEWCTIEEFQPSEAGLTPERCFVCTKRTHY